MWIVQIFSKGDLTNDDYLSVFLPSDSYSDDMGYRERYSDNWDLENRKEMLQDILERAQEELEFLNKYGHELIGKKSYSEVTFMNGGDVN